MVGKQFTIAPSTDYFGRDLVDCIRVVGSPLLKEEMDVDIKLPKRKPKRYHLKPTARNGQQTQRREQPPVTEEDSFRGPPPDDDPDPNNDGC